MKTFFRIKTLEQLNQDARRSGQGLRRTLGTFDLTMFGVAAIVGAGIFSAIGTAAAGSLESGRAPAGPALVLSILLVGLACAFTALAYAELAAMIPVSGSAYTYAYAALGEGFAWIIGWDLLLEYAFSSMAIAISWSSYARGLLASVLGIHIPGWLALDPRTALQQVPGTVPLALGDRLEALGLAREGLADGAALFAHWDELQSAPLLNGWPVTVNLPAALVTFAVTWLAYWGIKESARGNTVLVLLKLVVLLGVVGCGALFIDPANWKPFAPGGFRGVHAGAAIMFFAFVGFDSITTLTEECRTPGRSLPRGILWSLLLCTALYVVVAVVVTGMVRYDQLKGIGNPLAFIFTQHRLDGLAGAVAVGALIATTSALLAYQVAQPRVMMSMSRDGLLGPWFGRISPGRGTPAHATWLTGAMVAAPAALLNLEEVVELTNIGTLFAFIIVCAGTLILRVRRPEAPRAFRVRWPWLVFPLGILSSALLMAALPRLTWIRFILWLGLGLAVYLLYGRRRSRTGDS
jgi:APA family basic amino acid/polyamine antiporter